MTTMRVFPDDLVEMASKLLDQMRAKGLRLVTAESCTGGLISGLLTEVPRSSDVFERGYVTYSNESKTECLGVPMSLIERHGAVSREVAEAMAEGALKHSNASMSVAVTGIAGPGGGTAAKPVGLVHIAVHRKGHLTRHRECRIGDIERTAVRLLAIRESLALISKVVASSSDK